MSNVQSLPAPAAAARALFAAMLEGYAIHLDARNTKPPTTDARLRRLMHLYEELGGPWEWEIAGWARYQSARLHDGIALSTRRGDQNLVEDFSRYLNDPAYDWPERTLAAVGRHLPHVVITEANRIFHIEACESRSTVRPATRAELQRLYDYIDSVIDDVARGGGKGAVQTYRDGMYFKATYAFGWRRREGTLIESFDFARNIDVPRFGDFGLLHIRHGKAKPRGPERARWVYTVDTMDWIVPELARYCQSVRPLFTRAHSSYVFVGERGEPLCPTYASQRFAHWRAEAGLDPVITLHALRRSYITHLLEHGWAGRMVSEQVGHAHESSTAVYAGIGDDARRHELLRMQQELTACSGAYGQ